MVISIYHIIIAWLIIMRSIIVVDCLSTGVNFIGDIVNRGYKPIVLEMRPPDDDVGAYRAKFDAIYGGINEEFDMIFERDTYEETLEAVKKAGPTLIVPGNERGVILATRLSHDLGLLGNPIENLDAMTLKDEMHKRIAEHGLRSIKGRAVASVEAAVEFYDSESLNEVVVKPVYSAGSTGVRICMNKQEMIDAIEEVLQEKNYYGEDIDLLLVQERINGVEYIVNTVSCQGYHRVTLIWKYNMVKTAEGAILYDTSETVNELDIGEAEMVEYAYKVADAIGIQYGPIHGEYMIDENGPVLIEVNCRPCGANMDSKFLDRISGQHETDSVLDSYLKPTRFFEKAKERYRLQAHGALKLFNVPDNVMAKSSPITNMTPNLKSFYCANLMDDFGDGIFYVKTSDLHSVCGISYLVHEDPYVVQQDIEFLRNIEKKVFSLVLSEEKNDYFQLDEDKLAEDIKKVADVAVNYGTGLLITDQFIDNDDIVQISIDDFDNVNEQFDYILVNLNKSFVNNKDYWNVDLILNIFKRIKYGGIVFIPETTYNYVPGKREGVEALLRNMDLKIEVPSYAINTGIVASKNLN